MLNTLLLLYRSVSTAQALRLLLRTALTVACCLLPLVFYCHRQTPAPLPPAVAQRVELHRVESAVDSAEIKRLKQSAAVQQVKQDSAAVHARWAADSGNYRAAYVAEDTALLALDREVAFLDIALTRSESRAIRADSVIAAVLPLAESREPPCRILWFVPCPTRRAVAVAAAALTATVIVAAPRIHP